MRLLFIILAALSAALTSTAATTVFNWEGVPYTPIDRHTTLFVDGVEISFGGEGWQSFQHGGQLAYQPPAHGDIATLTFAWAAPVQGISVALAGLMHGNFTHLVNVAFFLGDQAVGHTATNLRSVQEQGGWLANVVQWNHDGQATVVANGAADSVTLSFTTRPGTSSAAPHYSAILLPMLTWATPVPEPSQLVYLIAGALCGLLIVRHIIRRYC